MGGLEIKRYRLFVLGTEQLCQVRQYTFFLTIILPYVIELKYCFNDLFQNNPMSYCLTLSFAYSLTIRCLN